jgi:hypothetical protein
MALFLIHKSSYEDYTLLQSYNYLLDSYGIFSQQKKVLNLVAQGLL